LQKKKKKKKKLIKRDGAKIPTAIHGPNGLNMLQDREKRRSCLENQFKPRELCDGNYKWVVGATGQALLEEVENSP
jgi:hypothetical protein